MGTAPEASLGEMPSTGPVGRTMREHSRAFINCGADSVTVQTGTVQNLQIRFSIDKEGKVVKSEIETMSMPDPDLRSCILGKLRKIEFPKPADKKQKDIRYPLIIKAGS